MLKLLFKLFNVEYIRYRHFIMIKLLSPVEYLKDTFFCHRVDSANHYVRDDYLVGKCSGKRVLHFGFLDCPITEEKINSCKLLHSKIIDVASYVYGVDIDEMSLAEYRRLTGDSQNCIQDILIDDIDLSIFKNNYDICNGTGMLC